MGQKIEYRRVSEIYCCWVYFKGTWQAGCCGKGFYLVVPGASRPKRMQAELWVRNRVQESGCSVMLLSMPKGSWWARGLGRVLPDCPRCLKASRKAGWERELRGQGTDQCLWACPRGMQEAGDWREMISLVVPGTCRTLGWTWCCLCPSHCYSYIPRKFFWLLYKVTLTLSYTFLIRCSSTILKYMQHIYFKNSAESLTVL